MKNPANGMRYVLLATAIGLSRLAAVAPVDSGLASEGKEIFRFDTFGDEQFWTDKLGLHEVVEEKVDPDDGAQSRPQGRRRCTCRPGSSKRRISRIPPPPSRCSSSMPWSA